MRCLVVDNDVMAADGLAAMLGSDATTMDQVHSGREVLDRIGRQKYDAAFVEIVLPDIDGCEVIRSIRNGGSNIPVLIVSTLSRPAAKVKGLRAGADDFITKPFDAGELRARVRAVLRRSTGLLPSAITRRRLAAIGSR
jgi:two-component system cell cycle response regulator CtrA